MEPLLNCKVTKFYPKKNFSFKKISIIINISEPTILLHTNSLQLVADALVKWYCSRCYNLVHVLLIFSGLNVSLLVHIILFLDEYKV